MRFGSENPVFKSGNYENDYSSESATYLGVTTKTIILLGIIAVMAMYTSATIEFENIGSYIFTTIGALIFGLIAVLVTHRKPHIGFIAAPIYALCEGFVLGLLSSLYAFAFGGAVVEYALMGTFGVFFVMLLLYSAGIIRVGPFFRRLMMSILIGLIVVNLGMFAYSLFSSNAFEYSSIYVVVSVISVIAASFFLLMDFDRITKYIEGGASKTSEWSLGLGIVTTIVWLYVEMLRIASIFMRD